MTAKENSTHNKSETPTHDPVDSGVQLPTPQEKKEGSSSPEMHVPEPTVSSMQGAQKKNSLLSNQGHVFDVSKAFESGSEFGTIVTDKKTERPHFLDVIVDASTERYGDYKRSAKKLVNRLKLFEKKEKIRVHRASSRKEIITEAGERAKHAPKDDHEVVLQKIKSTQKTAPQISYTRPHIVKKHSEERPPEWKYKIELEEELNAPFPPGEPTEHTQSIQGEGERSPQSISARAPAKTPTRAAPSPEVPKQKQQAVGVGDVYLTKEDAGSHWSHFVGDEDGEPNKEALSATEPPMKHAVEGTTPPDHKEKDPSPAPTGVTQHMPLRTDEGVSRSEETPPEAPPSGNAPLYTESTQKEIPQEKKPTESPVESHRMRNAILITVILVSIGAGTGAAFLIQFLSSAPPSEDINEEPSISIPSFIQTDRAVPILLEAPRTAFMTALQTAVVEGAPGFVQLYPVVDAQNTPATKTELFDVLTPRMSGTFMRALDERIMLGFITTSRNEPFIILRSHAFDVAFAGMIDWEPYIREDFSPLFESEGESTSVTSETETGTSSLETVVGFQDSTLKNKSVRVFVDTEGVERIVYVFVNRNTIIITRSMDALDALLTRI